MSLASRPATPYTVDDVWAMPDDGYRHELIDGVLIVTPAPNLVHQRCVMNLAVVLSAACDAGHEVVIAPFDWKLGEHTLFQPDLLVARLDDIGPMRLERPPVLAIEVQSPSTRRVDLLLKRDAFQSAGVADYWLVDPDVPSLTHLTLTDGAYVQAAFAAADEAFTTPRPFEVTVVPADLVRSPR